MPFFSCSGAKVFYCGGFLTCMHSIVYMDGPAFSTSTVYKGTTRRRCRGEAPGCWRGVWGGHGLTAMESPCPWAWVKAWSPPGYARAALKSASIGSSEGCAPSEHTQRARDPSLRRTHSREAMSSTHRPPLPRTHALARASAIAGPNSRSSSSEGTTVPPGSNRSRRRRMPVSRENGSCARWRDQMLAAKTFGSRPTHPDRSCAHTTVSVALGLAGRVVGAPPRSP